jgi:hypothetical protein
MKDVQERKPCERRYFCSLQQLTSTQKLHCFLPLSTSELQAGVFLLNLDNILLIKIAVTQKPTLKEVLYTLFLCFLQMYQILLKPKR